MLLLLQARTLARPWPPGGVPAVYQLFLVTPDSVELISLWLSVCRGMMVVAVAGSTHLCPLVLRLSMTTQIPQASRPCLEDPEASLPGRNVGQG